MKPPARIEVTWCDAHQLREEAELTAADAIERAHGPLVTTTAGYLIQSDAVGVTLGGEWQLNGNGETEEITFRHVCFIPRGMVTKEKVAGRRDSKVIPKSPRKRRSPEKHDSAAAGATEPTPKIPPAE